MLTDRDADRNRSTAAFSRLASCLALAVGGACATAPVQWEAEPQMSAADSGDADADAAASTGEAGPQPEAGPPDVVGPTGESEASEEEAATPEASDVDALADASPEAEVEAGSPEAGPPSAVETIEVTATGASAFKTSLIQGALYLLKASGDVAVGSQEQDAEFASAPSGSGSADVVGGVDVGIDVGLLQIHPPMGHTQVPAGPGRMKWYGAFRSDHTYYMIVTGAGQPLTLKLVTTGASGSGSIAVSLFLLAAAPPATDTPVTGSMPAAATPPAIGGAALDTVAIPVAKKMTKSNLTTNAAAVYLLQASGAGICGGGGLRMGDAEYMDWAATGAGANNNDGKCDFGIGVDETALCIGPRMRWWGPYRNDHVYYMLYAGTGSPVTFLYVDSGYGDNTATNVLGLSIFPVP